MTQIQKNLLKDKVILTLFDLSVAWESPLQSILKYFQVRISQATREWIADTVETITGSKYR